MPFDGYLEIFEIGGWETRFISAAPFWHTSSSSPLRPAQCPTLPLLAVRVGGTASSRAVARASPPVRLPGAGFYRSWAFSLSCTLHHRGPRACAWSDVRGLRNVTRCPLLSLAGDSFTISLKGDRPRPARISLYRRFLRTRTFSVTDAESSHWLHRIGKPLIERDTPRRAERRGGPSH